MPSAPADIDKLCAAVPDDLATLIRKHADIFPNDLPPGLPPERDHDHKIQLEPGAQPTVRTQWRLTQPELDELRRQLDYLLEKGFVRPSTSPFAAPILFTLKKDGGLRMCIDYRALNRLPSSLAILFRVPTNSSTNFVGQSSFQKLTCEAVTTRSVSTKLTATRRRSEPATELRVHGHAFWLNQRAFNIPVNHERSFSAAAG
ncbi:hypothetical protein CLOM_g23229 [Closterium sp. NIES-68]|nr:hypothetical protein CLOM_g23229 [Closterium sp. NIES-68]